MQLILLYLVCILCFDVQPGAISYLKKKVWCIMRAYGLCCSAYFHHSSSSRVLLSTCMYGWKITKKKAYKHLKTTFIIVFFSVLKVYNIDMQQTWSWQEREVTATLSRRFLSSFTYRWLVSLLVCVRVYGRYSWHDLACKLLYLYFHSYIRHDVDCSHHCQKHKSSKINSKQQA